MFRFIPYLLCINITYSYCLLDEKITLINFISFISLSAFIIFMIVYFNIDYIIIECKPNPGINCLFNYLLI